MSVVSWVKDPMVVVQGYEARHGQTLLSPLMMWAVWSVESLHYLDDLDTAAQSNYPAKLGPHSADIVDIAHVRWATGTAITALDLCAAALGRVCCGWTKAKEMDLRFFDVTIKKTRARATRLRSSLPPPALTWIDGVLSDTSYKHIQGARNRFTHAWMSRSLSVGGQGGHPARIHFKIDATESERGARTLVEDSKNLAGVHVNAFVKLAETL